MASTSCAMWIESSWSPCLVELSVKLSSYLGEAARVHIYPEHRKSSEIDFAKFCSRCVEESWRISTADFESEAPRTFFAKFMSLLAGNFSNLPFPSVCSCLSSIGLKRPDLFRAFLSSCTWVASALFLAFRHRATDALTLFLFLLMVFVMVFAWASNARLRPTSFWRCRGIN